MTRYSFILTQENRDKLLSSGLNIEPRLLDKKIFFEDTTTFYNCSTNCGTIYPMGAYSFARTWYNLFKVGNYCSIDNNTRIMAENHPYERFTISTITYQKNAGVGLEAVFRASGLERLNKIEIAPNPAQHSGIERLKKFRIASEVWIRPDCLLANNIKIGTGSCIEQGSVVVKDVPPYAIVAGNPAKITGYRFSEKIIEKMLETR